MLTCDRIYRKVWGDYVQDIAYLVTRQFRQELYDEIVKEFEVIMGDGKDCQSEWRSFFEI